MLCTVYRSLSRINGDTQSDVCQILKISAVISNEICIPLILLFYTSGRSTHVSVYNESYNKLTNSFLTPTNVNRFPKFSSAIEKHWIS